MMEGWEPTKKDVEELKAFSQVDHPVLDQEFKRIFGD